MPIRSKKICGAAACHQTIPGNQGYCNKHQRVNRGGFSGKNINPVRESFYKSTRWQKVRNQFIRSNPLCIECESEGVVKGANVADHIIDWQAGGSKYDWDNLQPLCHSHHNRKTGREANKRRGNITY